MPFLTFFLSQVFAKHSFTYLLKNVLLSLSQNEIAVNIFEVGVKEIWNEKLNEISDIVL